MALTMIIGGSGSGKTEFIYKKIIEQSINEPDRQFFVIVPEQATMQAQKEIVRLHPRHGTMNIDIVSFERLAYRIFSELAIPQPGVLDDIGKTMVLRRLAGQKRDDLAYFGANVTRPGFLDEIKSMISELYQYGITPEDLKETNVYGDLGQVLSAKLSDLGVLYQAFKDFIAERYITMEELLDRLCDVCDRSKLLKDSVVVLDGYTGFTPVQYRLIGCLMRLCADIFVTVTATAEDDIFGTGNESDLFDMSRKMNAKLNALAKENFFNVNEPVFLGKRPFPRFSGSPALDHMERTIFRYPYAKFTAGGDEINLVQAENPSAEISFVVNKIQTLIAKEGMRYRDIAVICGDLKGYSRQLAHQFEENGIPLFIDEKSDIAGNPFIRLIKSVLAIRQSDFDYESIFGYLRTGLVTEKRDMVDIAENYVRALGIRGFKRWSGEWSEVYEGAENMNLTELNAFRQEVITPLASFHDKTAGRQITAGEVTAALMELFSDLDIERKLSDKAAGFGTSGDKEREREYSEVYGLVSDLLERFVELLGSEIISWKEYADILDAGFAQIRVGMIPALADRVVAGDLTRTRLASVKVLFFVGVNEGVVPADTTKGGILTEQERETLKRCGIELSPTAREEGFMQRFYLYLMMTKPSDHLYISWTVMSASGAAMRRSVIINQIENRFPNISVKEASALIDPDISANAARNAVTGALQEPERLDGDEKFWDRYERLSARTDTVREMERLAEAVTYSYKDHGIGKEAAKELYGNVLSGSVTRLEGYAGCAYSHFLSYGLGLRERQEYEIDLSDMGTLFHNTIDLFFTRVHDEGKDFRAITDDERKSLVKECVNDVVKQYRNTIMMSSARNDYLTGKVERISDETVRALIYQIRKGDFEPTEFEADVNTVIPLDNGASMNLRGRIDRMDVYEDDDKIYVKIMDYKSGSRAFDIDLLYHGLQMQLVVYMDTALKAEEEKHPGKKAVPAGLFYYHIDDPLIERGDGATDGDIESALLRELRMNGLVNADLSVISHMDREIEKESDVIPVTLKDGILQETKSSVAGEKRFKELFDFTEKKLKVMGNEILNGNIATDPYEQGDRTACTYCPYHGVCGFDLKIQGFGYRKFKHMKQEEIWDELDGTATESD